MPIVVANLKPSVLAEIQRLVDEGSYISPGEFLELAAANQLELEGKEAGESSAADRPARVAASAPARPTPRLVQRARRAPLVTDDDITETLRRLRVPDPVAIPDSLAVKPPALSGGEGSIWGQVNRLLPLKVVVRWLAARALREGTWESVDAVLETMAIDAANLGTALERADADAERVRDELLSTGLPRRGNSLSTDRFLSQFVARTTRKGLIHPGAAMQYGLATLTDDAIALTTTGLDFATLPNPVMDGDLAEAEAALSEDEKQFFVRRAVPHLPSELRDFRLVLSFVSDGQNTPNDQIDLLREHLPEDWSDTMVRTHVTGVVARMVDLGLLRRQWEGRHVQYETTSLAEAFATLDGDDDA